MVLSVTIQGGKKSDIMSKARLNDIQVKRYIAFLLSQGLVEARIDFTNHSTFYQTTEKGGKFLEKYREGNLCDILHSSSLFRAKIEAT
jgi:predicted transcriptional regulator